MTCSAGEAENLECEMHEGESCGSMNRVQGVGSKRVSGTGNTRRGDSKF